VQHLRKLELSEYRTGEPGVVAIALKIGDHPPLTCNTPNALSEVLLRLV
jgi:hypothetical protein